MVAINLLNSTGVFEVDRIIGEVIRLGEYHFPGRIRGYYLVGSYAVGEAVATSDIDIVVVFKDSLTPEEKQGLASFKEECYQLYPLGIDITPVGEVQLLSTGGVRFQTASLLMYGEDLRAAVPKKPVEEHIRDSMYAQYRLFARVRGNPPRLTFPLDYPNPAGEFYGYDCRQMRLPDGTSHAGIKDLVLNVLCPAEALILLKAGKYVVNGNWKSECVTQYRIWINDEWAELVEAIAFYGRQQWAYLVPASTPDRQLLRHLCQRALGFENHFLTRYKEYLLSVLPQEEPFIQLHYVKQLSQLIYPDNDAIASVLRKVEKNATTELQQAVTQTLQWYS
jgi:hypothetical protein